MRFVVIVYLIVIASLLACGGCSKGHRGVHHYESYVQGDEIKGTWSLVPRSLELARRDGYVPLEGIPHDITLWGTPSGGECEFTSIIESDGKIEYVDERGHWGLSHDTDYRDASKYKNEIKIQLKGRNLRFYVTPEEDRFLLWNFWGDPSRREFLLYERQGDRPISFYATEKYRIWFTSGTSPGCFSIEVFTSATPRAVIRLEPSANSVRKKPWSDLIWHPIERSLTRAEIELLENYLRRIRSKSIHREIWPPFHYPIDQRIYEFQLQRLAVGPFLSTKPIRERPLRMQIVREEHYFFPKADEEMDRRFLEAFVGYRP